MLPEASRVGTGRFCTFFLLFFWGKGMGSSEIVWGFLIQTGSTGTACLLPQRIEWHFLSSKS